MKIIDTIIVQVKAGDGGDGGFAMNTKPYVTKTGPSGGDGGDGGSVLVQADANLKTLASRYTKVIRAHNGGNGSSKRQKGKNGANIIVSVPLGTKIVNVANNELLLQINEYDHQYVLLKGGTGGRGNAHLFKKNIVASNKYEPGTKVAPLTVKLSVDLVVDVGLVGLPNAGKSSLLAQITNAKPAIANYAFTTINPQIGIIKTKFKAPELLLVDLPGIIAGASDGKGLGTTIFTYLAKCKIIIHLIDIGTTSDIKNIIYNYHLIRAELTNYGQDLAQKPEVIVVNKIDLPPASANLVSLKHYFPEKTIIAISTFDDKSLRQLVNSLVTIITNNVTN